MKMNRSVIRIFQIMNFLITKREGATLSEIAKALDEPKTSVYDLLVAGVHMNYLRKNNKKFYVGAQTRKAGRAYIERRELIDVVSPIMVKASKEHNVSVSFVLLERNDLNYIFTIHPDNAVLVAREDSPIGFIHASAAGKLLLSHLPPAQRDKILPTLTYYKFTDRTIENEEELLKELDKVYESGYALDDREYSLLLQCISLPVYKDGNVFASLSFSDLNLYLTSPDEIMDKFLPIAQKISQLL